MSKFNEGDVVRYYNRERGRWRVGIVVDPEKYQERASLAGKRLGLGRRVWALFVDDGEWAWHDCPTHVRPDDVELHPDPGPVLASWVKEKLLCR